MNWFKKISWEDANLKSHEHLHQVFINEVQTVDLKSSEIQSPPPNTIWMIDPLPQNKYWTYDPVLKQKQMVCKFGFLANQRVYMAEVVIGKPTTDDFPFLQDGAGTSEEQINFVKDYGFMGSVARVYDEVEHSESRKRQDIQASSPVDFVERVLDFIRNDRRNDGDESPEFDPTPMVPNEKTPVLV